MLSNGRGQDLQVIENMVGTRRLELLTSTVSRYSEIIALRVQDFDAVAGTLLIAQSKSGRSRRVYLDEEGCEFFRSVAAPRRPYEPMFLRDGRPWGKDSAQGLMDVATKAAGIPSATFHELRHTAASRWARLGLSLQEIAAQLGHADVRMTQRYAHLCQQSLADKVRALPTMGISTIERESVEIGRTVQ